METKRVIMVGFVDFEVTPTNRYHGNWMSDFPKKSLFVEKFLTNIFNFLPFS